MPPASTTLFIIFKQKKLIVFFFVKLREQLENAFQLSLSPYKQYIDDVMLHILAQMDKPTMILPHLYLGSEWNASNFDELKANNIGYVLNVSREIDNFFPGHFKYLKGEFAKQSAAATARYKI